MNISGNVLRIVYFKHEQKERTWRDLSFNDPILEYSDETQQQMST